MTSESIDRLSIRPSPDEAAFEKLFYEYHQKLYFYFRKQAQSEFMAEELVQLTFIKLWRHLDRLSDEVPLSSQIFRIARTTLIDTLRKKAAEREALQHVELPGEHASTENTVYAYYLQQDIQAAIEQLPPIRKKVFQLSRLQGLSYQDIAQELSISTKTVEDHLTKATKHLKLLLRYSPVMLWSWLG
ncbi:RNA polymerase sigma factor [Pontibacter indicus]|uniref:RNA polymerase sigma-70 factor, ECF subfamily n=1 Tax=Pontibacter indicus TaxID=1317125 RepID=A0A1R3XRD8_9BACT|nr:RNA polymerase sigma-70 factor [Pontibacter indicus]SIT94013.1 RNA polymerase sigma-70 factor, ECF subfamily [Pontibacter indicus]